MNKNKFMDVLDELKEELENESFEDSNKEIHDGYYSEKNANGEDIYEDEFGEIYKTDKKALILGSAVIDEIIKIEKLPQRGDDVKCFEETSSLGGCAYNIACTMRNLGASHELCVPVGTGKHADEIREKLYARGYMEMIRDYEKDNGYCICLVESDGERSFITINGTESDFKREWLDLIECEKYEIICISGYQMCGSSGEIISKWISEVAEGKTVFFAPGPLITKIEPSIMNRMLSLSPIIHINEKEACDFVNRGEDVEEAAKYISTVSENMVIVTLGEKGALLVKDGEVSYTEGFKSEVEDTIGAGDSHLGAVISGFVNNMDIYTTLKLANSVASKIVGIKGAVMAEKEFKENVDLSELLY